MGGPGVGSEEAREGMDTRTSLCVARIAAVTSGDVVQVSQTCLLFTSRMKSYATYRFRVMSDLTVFLTSWSTNPPLKDSVSTSCVWVSEGVPS